MFPAAVQPARAIGRGVDGTAVAVAAEGGGVVGVVDGRGSSGEPTVEGGDRGGLELAVAAQAATIKPQAMTTASCRADLPI